MYIYSVWSPHLQFGSGESLVDHVVKYISSTRAGHLKNKSMVTFAHQVSIALTID